MTDKTISNGEIYFRMVQCLYKKFTIRKGIKFETSSLVNVLMAIGKLALETLLSGKSELERSQIIEQVGEEVFEYGLLIGEDGFSLTLDMTVDILVTFPHRSLQQFLGAFYFVLSLGKKQTVNHVEEAFREYLENPLFSEFCLWFLIEPNRFFSFPERSMARKLLTNYVTEQIDAVEVDFQTLERNYPALSLALGDNRNEFALKILEAALVKCSRIKHIVMDPHHPVNRILRSIHPDLIQGFKSIEMSKFQETLITSPLQFLYVRHDHSFNLTVKCDIFEKSADALNTVLKVCEGWNKSVYLWVCEISFRKLLQDFPSVHTLSTTGRSSHYILPLNKMYPQLVNLFLTGYHFDLRDMSLLAEASAQGRLPKLSTLDLGGNHEIGGNLSVLLSQCFPSLTTLILCHCDLEMSDAQSLAQARRMVLLPKLRHLDLSFNYRLNFASKLHSDKSPLLSLFDQVISTLNTLVTRRCGLGSDDLYKLHPQEVGNSNLLSELTTLDMSFSLDIRGSLSALMSHYFLHLRILVLRACFLNSEDLISLAQAISCGRLPVVMHLDMSQNYIGSKTRRLFKFFGGLKGVLSLQWRIQDFPEGGA